MAKKHCVSCQCTPIKRQRPGRSHIPRNGNRTFCGLYYMKYKEGQTRVVETRALADCKSCIISFDATARMVAKMGNLDAFIAAARDTTPKPLHEDPSPVVVLFQRDGSHPEAAISYSNYDLRALKRARPGWKVQRLGTLTALADRGWRIKRNARRARTRR